MTAALHFQQSASVDFLVVVVSVEGGGGKEPIRTEVRLVFHQVEIHVSKESLGHGNRVQHTGSGNMILQETLNPALSLLKIRRERKRMKADRVWRW